MFCCGGAVVAPAASRSSLDVEVPKPPKKVKNARTAPEDSGSEDVDDGTESFRESLLDVALRKDRELVLVVHAQPSMKRDSATIALQYKGLKYMEDLVEGEELPYYLKEACVAPLHVLFVSVSPLCDGFKVVRRIFTGV